MLRKQNANKQVGKQRYLHNLHSALMQILFSANGCFRHPGVWIRKQAVRGSRPRGSLGNWAAGLQPAPPGRDGTRRSAVPPGRPRAPRTQTHTHIHLPEWQVPGGRSIGDLLSVNCLHYFAKSLLPPNRLCVVLTTKGRRRKSGNVSLVTPISLGHFMTRTYTHKAQDHTLCHFRGPQEGKAAGEDLPVIPEHRG